MRRKLKIRSNTSSLSLYIIAVVALAGLTISLIVALIVLRPPSADNTAIIATIIGFVTPTMLGLLALIQRENHLALNSRLEDLLDLSGRNQRAEGKLEAAVEIATYASAGNGTPPKP